MVDAQVILSQKKFRGTSQSITRSRKWSRWSGTRELRVEAVLEKGRIYEIVNMHITCRHGEKGPPMFGGLCIYMGTSRVMY